MPQFRYIVITVAADGRDAEFNDWYDNVHIADVLAVPGFASVERSVVVRSDKTVGPTQYVAIYELDTDEPGAVLEDLRSRVADGRIPMSDTLGGVERYLCRVITPSREK